MRVRRRNANRLNARFQSRLRSLYNLWRWLVSSSELEHFLHKAHPVADLGGGGGGGGEPPSPQLWNFKKLCRLALTITLYSFKHTNHKATEHM